MHGILMMIMQCFGAVHQFHVECADLLSILDRIYLRFAKSRASGPGQWDRGALSCSLFWTFMDHVASIGRPESLTQKPYHFP